MVESGEMLKSDDILDILNIKLLGKIPEDKNIIDASNQGKPVILNNKSAAGQAYLRVAKRLSGQSVPFEDVESTQAGGVFKKLAGMFR
jgi:septum site-determining protein MinD